MQSAETVLGVLRDRGRRGLPCIELYRQMFNINLYLLAYGRIYANQGAMTPGASAETADGMSEDKIEQIIEAMRHERYRFSPARRTFIPKKNGKLRPLGLPTWSDKLAGEVVRLLLEAYYEPTFSGHSHGFRPGKGCHTALREVESTWTGTTWFIEGDISDCFGSLDHEIMVTILSEKIHDNRFLRLIRNMLTAGYLEDWEYRETLSGAPQGGVVSPILSNIYLNKLDVFAETVLIPQHTRGKLRRPNREYRRIDYQLARARENRDRDKISELQRKLRQLPSGDPQDPGYRRLRYTRYADDHLLGFTGPKAEAEAIKDQLARFLREELALELNPDKTLVTHARTRAARYLGYEIIVQHSSDKITSGRRAVNGTIALRVPLDVIKAKRAPYRRHGKPWHRPALQNLDDYDIIQVYGAEYRGIVGDYLLLATLAAGMVEVSDVRWGGGGGPRHRRGREDGAPGHGRDRVRRGARPEGARSRRRAAWPAGAGRRAGARAGGAGRSGTRGDPMSPLRWTTKLTAHRASELTGQGHAVTARTVASLLAGAGYSLRATPRPSRGSSTPIVTPSSGTSTPRSQRSRTTAAR